VDADPVFHTVEKQAEHLHAAACGPDGFGVLDQLAGPVFDRDVEIEKALDLLLVRAKNDKIVQVHEEANPVHDEIGSFRDAVAFPKIRDLGEGVHVGLLHQVGRVGPPHGQGGAHRVDERARAVISLDTYIFGPNRGEAEIGAEPDRGLEAVEAVVDISLGRVNGDAGGELQLGQDVRGGHGHTRGGLEELVGWPGIHHETLGAVALVNRHNPVDALGGERELNQLDQ
jgi:hypothetical protein